MKKRMDGLGRRVMEMCGDTMVKGVRGKRGISVMDVWGWQWRGGAG